MAQLTLNVADNQVQFFLELIKNFDFVKVQEDTSNFVLSEAQKSIVDERMEDYKNNPDSFLDIDDVKENLRKEHEI